MSDDLSHSKQKPKRYEQGDNRTRAKYLFAAVMLAMTCLALIGFAALIALPVGMVSSPEFAKTFSPVFCASDRTLVVERGSGFPGHAPAFKFNSSSVYFYCADHDLEFTAADDISSRFMLIFVALGFMPVLFVVLLTSAGTRFAIQYIRQVITTGNLTNDLTPVKHDQMERLRELKRLFKQGLMTKEEYDRKREEILQA